MRSVFICIVVLPALACGQVDLVIQEIGRFNCSAIFKIDGDRLLGQVTEYHGYNPIAFNYAAIFDISYPNRPRELMRCMPVDWQGWDEIHQIPGVIREAVIYDSLIIALRLVYTSTDINYGDFWATVSAAPVRTGEIIAEQCYESVAPEDSFFVWWEDPMPDGMGLAGNHLIVGMGRLGIYTFDLSQDQLLEEVSHIEINCSQMCVSGDRLIAVENDGWRELGIRVYDITDPSQPEETGWLETGGRYTGSLTVIGDYLYATPFTLEDQAHLAIIDIRSDDAPEIVVDIDDLAPCDGRFSTTFGDNLYLRDNNYIAVYDISEPLAPQQIIAQPVNVRRTNRIDAFVKYIYLTSTYDSPSPELGRIFYFGPDAAPESGNTVATTFNLQPVYPNPFNDQAVITCHITQPGFVSLKIFDAIGRQVFNQHRFSPSGESRWMFEGTGLPAGSYLIVANSNGETISRTAVLLK